MLIGDACNLRMSNIGDDLNFVLIEFVAFGGIITDPGFKILLRCFLPSVSPKRFIPQTDIPLHWDTLS